LIRSTGGVLSLIAPIMLPPARDYQGAEGITTESTEARREHRDGR
jgi:hypothetical protein